MVFINKGYISRLLLIVHRCECECAWFVPICQPCDDLVTYSGCTPPSPIVSWDQLQPPPRDPEKGKRFQIINGWMDGWMFTTLLFLFKFYDLENIL